MAYCRRCGVQIDEMALICPKCGAIQQNVTMRQTNAADSGSVGWAVLGYFIPILGLILYLVWKKTKPMSSQMAGTGALISVFSSIIIVTMAMSMIGP